MTDLMPAAGALPAIPDTDPRWREVRDVTLAWLASRRSARTRDAYRRDLAAWFAFCDQRALPSPLHARLRDAGHFCGWLTAADNPRPLGTASAARRMSAVSSWYQYLVRNGVVDANPFKDAERPQVDRDYTATAWLTETQARALVAAATAGTGSETLRNVAMARLMLEVGVRVTEVVTLPVTALGHVQGHRVVTVRGKGNKRVARVVPPVVGAAVDAYLAARADRAGVAVAELQGPLFVSRTGRAVSRHDVFRLVRRLARTAGHPNPDAITPHSLRHTFATVATERGATLEEVQDAMGHADPRTTRRYQRSVRRLERDPSQLVAAALG